MKILIGITGSIAAYKANTITREFVKQGHEVAVIVTESGLDFTSKLTLSTFASNGVYTDLMDPEEDQPIHINLARWADVFLIAPCSLNTIGKMSSGIADNLLLATFFAFEKKTLIAPAMNDLMYANGINQENIKKLKEHGVIEIPPRWGDLASYDPGKGPMAEVEVIIKETLNANNYSNDMQDKIVVITAGGTSEQIDPVRVITNLSTGTMGYEIALACYRRGAKVKLITTVPRPLPSDIEMIPVASTADMFNAVHKNLSHADIFIASAAVSDFVPESADMKIKKDNAETLKLKKNTDILEWVLENRNATQMIVGFAAETELTDENIERKLKSKPVDILFANLISDEAGFGDLDVRGMIIKGKKSVEMEMISKTEAAALLCDLINDK